jgi:hypothetical protein
LDVTIHIALSVNQPPEIIPNVSKKGNIIS